MVLYLFDDVSNLELIFLGGQLLLNLRVGVVYDGQKHVLKETERRHIRIKLPLSSDLSGEDAYQQNKENEEDVGHKVDGPENPVGLIDGVKVEVSEDDPELCESAGETWMFSCCSTLHRSIVLLSLHALYEGAEGVHLCSKEQVPKLSVSEENDEKHDGKSHDVFGASTQCSGELCHGLIETDVFENL